MKKIKTQYVSPQEMKKNKNIKKLSLNNTIIKTIVKASSFSPLPFILISIIHRREKKYIHGTNFPQ